MHGNSSEIKFTKEDREKLQEELEREQQEEKLDKEEAEEKKEEEKEKQKEKQKKKKKTKHKTKKKKDKDKKDKDKKNKKGNRNGVPFTYVLLLMFIVGVIVALGVYYYFENERDVEFDNKWQETYYNFLEGGIIKKGKDEFGKEINNYSKVYQEKNPKMYMLEVENLSYPIMITESSGYKDEYQKDTDIEDIYTIHSIGYSNTVNYDNYYNVEDIEFLYNINNDTSGWYLKLEENDEDVYIELEQIVKYSKGNTTEYKISEDEFDNNFIKVNTNISKYKLNNNMSSNRLKNTIVKATNSIKEIDDILTDKTLKDINKKINKESEEETEKVEDTKKEEEEKETKQETTSNKLKVGEYTLDYGTYSNNSISLTIKSGGICEYKDEEIKETCSYKIEGDSNSGFQLIVTLSNDKKYYIISSNNKIGNLNYQG